jgi:hypothetical protein
VTHGGLESQPIRTARREALVPQPCPTAVAATGISQHRQLRRCRVGCSSLLFPPASNGVDGKTRARRPTCQRRPHRGCSGRRRCHRAQLTPGCRPGIMEVDRDRLKAPGVPSRLEVTDEFLLFQWRTWAPVSTTALVQGVVCDPRRSLEPGWRRRLRRSKRIGSSSPPGSIRIIRSGRASAIARSTGRAGCLHDAAALGEVSGV